MVDLLALTEWQIDRHGVCIEAPGRWVRTVAAMIRQTRILSLSQCLFCGKLLRVAGAVPPQVNPLPTLRETSNNHEFAKKTPNGAASTRLALALLWWSATGNHAVCTGAYLNEN